MLSLLKRCTQAEGAHINISEIGNSIFIVLGSTFTHTFLVATLFKSELRTLLFTKAITETEMNVAVITLKSCSPVSWYYKVLCSVLMSDKPSHSRMH